MYYISNYLLFIYVFMLPIGLHLAYPCICIFQISLFCLIYSGVNWYTEIGFELETVYVNPFQVLHTVLVETGLSLPYEILLLVLLAVSSF